MKSTAAWTPSQKAMIVFLQYTCKSEYRLEKDVNSNAKSNEMEKNTRHVTHLAQFQFSMYEVLYFHCMNRNCNPSTLTQEDQTFMVVLIDIAFFRATRAIFEK